MSWPDAGALDPMLVLFVGGIRVGRGRPAQAAGLRCLFLCRDQVRDKNRVGRGRLVVRLGPLRRLDQWHQRHAGGFGVCGIARRLLRSILVWHRKSDLDRSISLRDVPTDPYYYCRKGYAGAAIIVPDHSLGWFPDYLWVTGQIGIILRPGITPAVCRNEAIVTLAPPQASTILALLGQAAFVWDIVTDAIAWSDHAASVFPDIPASARASGLEFSKLIEPVRSIRTDALSPSPLARSSDGAPYRI